METGMEVTGGLVFREGFKIYKSINKGQNDSIRLEIYQNN